MNGTAHALIKLKLQAYPEYNMHRRAEINMKAYQYFLDSNRELLTQSLTLDQCQLSARTPPAESLFVEEILHDLLKNGLIQSSHYSEKEFDSCRKTIESSYDHGNFTTYIFPEEERLLFALASIKKPKHILFMGSFYGYWAIWAALATSHAATKITLIDIDRDALDLSKNNMEKLGVSNINYIHTDAIEYVSNNQETYDMIVLDAEGPKNSGPKELRDKAIYLPMVKAAIPKLEPNCLMIAHNILFENITKSSYFEEKILDNEKQLGEYRTFMKSISSKTVEYSTSEGVGIYLL